jgi:hypothetical protein
VLDLYAQSHTVTTSHAHLIGNFIQAEEKLKKQTTEAKAAPSPRTPAVDSRALAEAEERAKRFIIKIDFVVVFSTNSLHSFDCLFFLSRAQEQVAVLEKKLREAEEKLKQMERTKSETQPQQQQVIPVRLFDIIILQIPKNLL